MRLKGGPELLELLGQVPAKIGRNAVRRGAYAAARVVREQARANVTSQSGDVARTLKISTRTDRQVISAKVAAKGRGSFVAPFIEYGVDPHLITAKRRQAMKIGDRYVSGVIHHPGHAPHAFLRPALDTKAEEAIAEMGRVISESLSWSALKAPALAIEADEE